MSPARWRDARERHRGADADHLTRHRAHPTGDPGRRAEIAEMVGTTPWWGLLVLRFSCRILIGHCWHRAWSGTPERQYGRWFCCECPAARDWDPSAYALDCPVCVGPGCGVSP